MIAKQSREGWFPIRAIAGFRFGTIPAPIMRWDTLLTHEGSPLLRSCREYLRPDSKAVDDSEAKRR